MISGDGVMLRTLGPHDLHVAVCVETALRLHDVVVHDAKHAEVSRSASVLGETEMERLVSQCLHDHAPSGLSGGLPNQLGSVAKCRDSSS